MCYYKIIILLCCCWLLACEETVQEPPVTIAVNGLSERLQLKLPKPWSVAVNPGDKTLIAAISHTENYLSVWSVDGDRVLQQLAQEETGYHPDGVRWVDWDNDGDTDELVVTVEGIKEIQLWSFGFWGLKKESSLVVQDAPQNVEITDLDGDEQPDLVVGPYSNPRVNIFWGKGDFQFTEPQYLPAKPVPAYPGLVDWNNDGLLDIVWGDWHRGTVRLALNKGQRQFEVNLLQELPDSAPRQLGIADLNNDGFADLIVASEVGKAAWILYNDGGAGISDQEKIPAPIAGYSDVTVSNDDQELIALSETNMIVLARRIDNEWQLRKVSAGGLALDLQLIDIDNDGIQDLIFANSDGDDVEVVFGPLWDRAERLAI